MTSLPAPTPDDKGIIIYTLTPDISLYRGSRDVRSPGNAPLKYFAFMREEAAQYGRVREYHARRPLHLVALDVDNPVFYDGARGATVPVERTIKGRTRTYDIEIQDALQHNFGFGADASRLRVSDNSRDSVIAKYCCDLGYDGYAISRMRTADGGVFHAEAAICNTGDTVKLSGATNTDDTKTRSSLASRSTAASRTTQRTHRTTPRTPASTRKGRRLFGSPSPPKSVRRGALFGSPDGGSKTRIRQKRGKSQRR